MARIESIYKQKTLQTVQLTAMYSKRFIQNTFTKCRFHKQAYQLFQPYLQKMLNLSAACLSREVSANAGFPSDKAAALRHLIKITSILLHRYQKFQARVMDFIFPCNIKHLDLFCAASLPSETSTDFFSNACGFITQIQTHSSMYRLFLSNFIQ